MKTLTLYTTGYQSILKNFLAGEPYREEFHEEAAEKAEEAALTSVGGGLEEGEWPCDFAAESDAVSGFEPLAAFLEYIAILEHPVYRHSAKLTKMALELEGTKIHAENIKNLAEYAQENNTLHLEGYTAFRMGEYRMKLDMMMYYIVKSLKIYSRPQ